MFGRFGRELSKAKKFIFDARPAAQRLDGRLIALGKVVLSAIPHN